MKAISLISPAIRRLRTRMLIERAIGLFMLAALGYWACAEFVTFVFIIYFVPFSIIEAWQALVEGSIVVVFVAVTLAAWWTLLLPGKRGSTRLNPSLGRLGFRLALLLKAVSGWPVRVATVDTATDDPGIRWYICIVIVLLTAAASVISCAAAGSWLAGSALAALMPLLGIVSSRLAASVPSVGRETRLDRAVAAAALALVPLFVLFATWQRDRIDLEERTTKALKAAIIAGGIGGGGWSDLQKVLRLSIFAQATAPSRLSAETLRRAVDALPVRAASVHVRNPDARISEIAVSPTGAHFAAATPEDIRIWGKAADEEIGRFACEQLRAFAFSHNDAVLAAVCGLETLVVWDVAARRVLYQTAVSNPSKIQISPDDRYLAAIDGRNCVEIFSIPNHRSLARHCVEAAIIGVTFDPTGSYIAIAQKTDPVSLEFLDLASSAPTASTEAPSAWNPAEESFVLLTSPNEATVFSWRSAHKVKRIDHTNALLAYVSAAGDRLITVGRTAQPSPSRDRLEFKVWTLPDAMLYDDLQVDNVSSITMIVDRDAQIVAWSGENAAYYWKVGDKASHIGVPTMGPITLDAAHHALMVSSENTGLLWSFDSGSKAVLLEPNANIIDVQFGSASRTAVLYADHVLVLDPQNGSRVAVISVADVQDVFFAPSGEHATIRTKDGELTLWSLAEGTAGQVRLALPRSTRRAAVAFAPDSTLLVVDTGSGELQLFDLASIMATSARFPFGSAYET